MENEKEILDETTQATEKQAEATENAADVNEEVAGNQEQEETVSEVDDKKEGKKIFKGKEKSEKKKDKNKEKIEELEDKVKRQMAEFENFRKRTEKEKSMMYEMPLGSLVTYGVMSFEQLDGLIRSLNEG